MASDTTHRDEETGVASARPQIWLRWAFPEGRSVPLAHALVIGRDETCDVHLDSSSVSRRHAEIYRQGPSFAIKDLGSTNGIFVNGARAQHAAVVPGSVLRIGEYVGIFSETAGTPRPFSQLASGLFGGDEIASAMHALRPAASTDIPIVLIGATGTGKERVARAVHEFSARGGAFHALNCAALPRELAEAELFGYRKGAFTGAERAGVGHFRAADRGTLFLDEVAELPLAIQSKLLRVLEERVVTPLGDTIAIPVDIRIVCAAQRPFADLVATQQFREDLSARLSGLTITLPSLRERRSDIPPLFAHFLHHHSGGRPPRVDPKLVEALCLYDWPANVRELEHAARQMLAVHGLEPVLKMSALPRQILTEVPPRDRAAAPSEFPDRRQHDLHGLTLALHKTRGNIASAATLLGISRQRAYRLLDGRSVEELLNREPVSNVPVDGSE